MRSLLQEYDTLLDQHSYSFMYHTTTPGDQGDGGEGSTAAVAGDLLLLDNLAVSHRAVPSAHDPDAGLRILHRTTAAGKLPLDPPPESGLPPFLCAPPPSRWQLRCCPESVICTFDSPHAAVWPLAVVGPSSCHRAPCLM